jgi:ribonuclease P protein component
MKHETNLSSLQNPPQTQVRLPRSHENHNGPQAYQPPPQSRQRDSLRLTTTDPETDCTAAEEKSRSDLDGFSSSNRQAVSRKSLIFRKKDRLLKRHEFKRISRARNRLVGVRLCIDLAQGRSLRLGITTPAHYGSSPERSRFKRLVREAFRLNRENFPQNIEINVSPRKFAKKAAFADIQEELLQLLNTQKPC